MTTSRPHPTTRGPRSRRHRWTAVLAALPVALAVLVPAGPTQAAPQPKPQRELRVLTQNLYLGSSLSPVLGATTEQEFLEGVAQVNANVRATDFPRRSRALARRIARVQPDVIGLQEVTRWVTVDRGAGTEVVLDFLDVLLEDLAAQGMSYSVGVSSENALIGPVPLISPCSDPEQGCTLEFQDRDVILVNDRTPGLKVLRSKTGTFEAQVEIPTPFGATISFGRGWGWIVAKYRGQKFRVVNTHLETQAAPEVQEAQAAELLSGPASPRGRKILLGDFNSAGDGSGTASYGILTGRYRDAWTRGIGNGFTCCQRSLLQNEENLLGTRIDLVLTRGALAPTKARVFSRSPFRRPAPRWVSDHAGVLAKVRFR